MNQIILNGLEVNQFLEAVQEIVRTEVNKALLESQPKTQKYYTKAEAAEKLNICLASIHLWTKQGKIKAHKVGSRVLYKESDLEDALIKVNKYGRTQR